MSDFKREKSELHTGRVASKLVAFVVLARRCEHSYVRVIVIMTTKRRKGMKRVRVLVR